MEKIGVEARVEGLLSFLSSMGKIDKSIAGVGKSGDLLGNVFSTLGKIVSGLVSGIFRVLEYTLGNLLAGAIRSVLESLKDLIAGVLESGDTFAKLQIRLERLNFNALHDSGMEYNDAIKESIRLTKEQLDWTIKLGAQTPYDSKDIANIYTLSRGYGFSAEEAKGLTEAVVQFTAGMGLTNVELERIMINFGQLRQQGKLNAQDLRDLARGAFVPINKIIEITAGKLGITVEEFNKLRKSGKLGAEAVDIFRQSFEELVGVNFEGAGQALGNIFGIALENVKGLIHDLLGLYVVAPVLLLIGGYLQDITNALVGNETRWNSVMDSIKRIGAAILGIIADLMGLLPSTEDIASGVTDSLDSIATWLEVHRGDIVSWVQNTVAKVGEIFDKISNWVSSNGPTIKEFFKTLGEIISTVFSDLSGQTISGDFLGGFLDSLTWFMQLIILNKDEIIAWTEVLIKALAIFVAINLALDLVVKIVTVLASALLSMIGIWKLFSGVLFVVREAIMLVLALLGSPITIIIAAVVANIWLMISVFTIWKNMALAALDAMKVGFQLWWANVVTTVQNVRNAFLNGDWTGIGRAIIQGVINGIGIMVGSLVSAAYNAAMAAYNTVRRTLGIHSPSSLFMDIGELSMKGMAIGIEKYAGLASNAMLKATSHMAMSGMGMMPSSVTNNSNTTNYNPSLTIHSSAKTESVIQDFNMMQSLVGG